MLKGIFKMCVCVCVLDVKMPFYKADDLNLCGEAKYRPSHVFSRTNSGNRQQADCISMHKLWIVSYFASDCPGANVSLWGRQHQMHSRRGGTTRAVCLR